MKSKPTVFLQQHLESLKERSLYRHLRTIESEQGPWVTLEGRRVLNLCSNNYLGLASNERIKAAAVRAISRWGCGSGASRLICGNLELHEALERRLATFKGTQAALLYNSGYTANLGIISSLVGQRDTVFSDELNHASIVDGCRLSRAQVIVFPHNDLNSLEEKLRSASHLSEPGRKLIIVDGVFSVDGDLAPLPGLVNLAEEYDALLMVDEAHATGAIGPGGRGVIPHFGLENRIPIIMGTLGKALGCFGAFVAGDRELVDFLINTSRSLIYTTALPPAVVASAMEAIDILEANPSLPLKLQENATYLRQQLQALGYSTLNSQTQIIPVVIGKTKDTLEMSQHLLEEGVLVTALRPPTVPEESSRLRVTVTAAHNQEDLDFALQAFRKAGLSLGII